MKELLEYIGENNHKWLPIEVEIKALNPETNCGYLFYLARETKLFMPTPNGVIEIRENNPRGEVEEIVSLLKKLKKEKSLIDVSFYNPYAVDQNRPIETIKAKVYFSKINFYPSYLMVVLIPEQPKPPDLTVGASRSLTLTRWKLS